MKLDTNMKPLQPLHCPSPVSA